MPPLYKLSGNNDVRICEKSGWTGLDFKPPSPPSASGVKGLNGPQASATPFLREICGGEGEAGGRWGLQYQHCPC